MKVNVEIASETMWWTAFMMTQRLGPRLNSLNRTSGSRSRSYGLRYSRMIVRRMSSQPWPWTSNRPRSGSVPEVVRCTGRPSSRWKLARSAGWRATSLRTASNISSGSISARTSTAPPML